MLQTLANLDPHPESVPINALVAVPGTPLEDRPPVDPLDLVRMVAAARMLMPPSRVRLSAGRQSLTLARGAAALHPRRRQLDLLRRQAAHHRQQRRGRRPRPDRRGGIAHRTCQFLVLRATDPHSMSRTVYVNGSFVPEADAKVSIFDRAFLFADGIYEVTAVLGGCPIDLDGSSGSARPLARRNGDRALPSPMSNFARCILS